MPVVCWGFSVSLNNLEESVKIANLLKRVLQNVCRENRVVRTSILQQIYTDKHRIFLICADLWLNPAIPRHRR